MPEKNNLQYALGLKPEKAIEYFKEKGYTVSWDWQDTWQEAHAKAFTVAKAMRLDVLQDIRSEVQKALDDGITFQQFKKELEPRLKAKGWWGKVMVGDETGAQTVQLGSPYRLKNIYRTNLQSSYMAGQYRAQIENADNEPYWMYNAILDSKTRPSHRALHGKVFRWDDSIWNSIYPPNDWGCRCSVRSLSGKVLDRKGLEVESSKGNLREEYRLISGRTGEMKPVTIYRDTKTGIEMSPGPGWNYNPGRVGWHPDLDKYDTDLAQQYLSMMITSPEYQRFYNGEISQPFPVGLLEPELQKAIGVKTKVVFLTDWMVNTHRHHANIQNADYQHIPEILKSAQVIIKDSPQSLIFIAIQGRKKYYIALGFNHTNNQVNIFTFHSTNTRQLKKILNEYEVIKNDLK